MCPLRRQISVHSDDVFKPAVGAANRRQIKLPLLLQLGVRPVPRRRRPGNNRWSHLRRRGGDARRLRGGGRVLRAAASRRGRKPRLRLLALKRRGGRRRRWRTVVVFRQHPRYGLVHYHEVAEGARHRPVDGVEERAEAVHGRRSDGVGDAQRVKTSAAGGDAGGRRQAAHHGAVASASRRQRGRLGVSAGALGRRRGQPRWDRLTGTSRTLDRQRRSRVGSSFARERENRRCRTWQLQPHIHIEQTLITLAIQLDGRRPQ